MHGRTSAGQRRCVEPTSGWWRRQRHRRSGVIKRVRLVYNSKHFQYKMLGLTRMNECTTDQQLAVGVAGSAIRVRPVADQNLRSIVLSEVRSVIDYTPDERRPWLTDDSFRLSVIFLCICIIASCNYDVISKIRLRQCMCI